MTMTVDAARGTMSTVYGNDLAMKRVRGGPIDSYSPGSVIARVTWAQREHPHWYGARIPGPVKSAEFVTVGPPSGTGLAGTYQAFAGESMRSTDLPAPELEARRAALIGEQAAPFPDLSAVHGE
jgi:hypothetical protein